MKKEELEEFILKYGTDLMKFCKITTNDDELAMELYQETMLRMVEHYKKLEVSENIKAWAISTAINLWKIRKENMRGEEELQSRKAMKYISRME